jgi:hypothetical protein
MFNDDESKPEQGVEKVHHGNAYFGVGFAY